MQRFYAFVQTRTGDLGEQLVENGLRSGPSCHGQTRGVNVSRGRMEKLISLEHKAKREKVGGWGANEERIAVRAQQPESEKGIDPFDKFFHPAGEAPVPVTAATPASPHGLRHCLPRKPAPSGLPGSNETQRQHRVAN